MTKPGLPSQDDVRSSKKVMRMGTVKRGECSSVKTLDWRCKRKERWGRVASTVRLVLSRVNQRAAEKSSAVSRTVPFPKEEIPDMS